MTVLLSLPRYLQSRKEETRSPWNTHVHRISDRQLDWTNVTLISSDDSIVALVPPVNVRLDGPAYRKAFPKQNLVQGRCQKISITVRSKQMHQAYSMPGLWLSFSTAIIIHNSVFLCAHDTGELKGLEAGSILILLTHFRNRIFSVRSLTTRFSLVSIPLTPPNWKL